MLNLGVVQQDATIYVPVPTRGADGGNVAPSGTITQADFTITYVTAASSTVLTLDASTITWSASLDSIAGKNRVSVDLSNDTDLQNAGGFYELWWESDATVDSITPVECLAVWTLETDTQKALRTFNSAAFITDTVTTTTSNTTTAVNLTDFLDAQAPDNSTTGELWLWQDSTGELEYFRVQSMTSLVATVEAWPAGGALSAAVAASDKLWRVGYVDVNTAAISDDIVAADNWEEFASAIVTGIAGATSLSTTTCSSDLTSYADDELIGRTIIFTSGTAAGQAARVTDYANTNGVLTFTAITTAPLQNDIFVVV